MIKKLAKSIRQYKRQAILTPVTVAGEVVLEVAIPLVMADLIDKGIDAGNLTVIWQLGLVLVLMALCSLAFGVLAGRLCAQASAGFATNLRQDMFYRVQDFSFANIDKFSTGGIVTRLTTDVTNVQQAFMMIIRVAVRCPMMLVFSLIMSFRISARLAMMYVFIIPVLAVGLYLIMSRVHPMFERVFTYYDALNNVVEENLHGIRVVKSYVREEHEIGKFSVVSQHIYRLFTKAEKILAGGTPLMQTAAYTCMLLISWIGARMIVGGSLSTGQLMSLMTYAMQVLMSMMMLSMIFVMITISRASAERICELLDEEPSIVNGDAPLYAVPDGSVSFRNVSFRYGAANDTEHTEEGKLSLSEINLDIPSGATVGILGGTGSSKTTLVQLIPRLYDVTSGQVLVGGHDVRDYDLQTLRDAVAMVLQKNVLFSGTIKENLRWGDPDATDEEIEHACRLAQAHSFISQFPDGYDTYIEQGGSNVSGGQKQRLCIARALLKKPKILILDDSTSAVDTATDAMIRQAFRNEIPDTTKFIIAQRVASVEDADMIIVLDGGSINAIGTHQELLNSNDIYREVYMSQMKGGTEDA